MHKLFSTCLSIGLFLVVHKVLSGAEEDIDSLTVGAKNLADI